MLCRAELAPAFVRLLRDNEPEVRIAAAGKVASFCRMMDAAQIIQQIIPCVKELSNDSSQLVRAALASVVLELAPMLGKQPTIDHLVPVFLSLLKDIYPEVRLNVISKLDQVRARLWLGRACHYHLLLLVLLCPCSCCPGCMVELSCLLLDCTLYTA
jgi:uncharacterized protein (DUF2336 family)